MNEVTLIPLGDPGAAVCEGDFCVIPAADAGQEPGEA